MTDWITNRPPTEADADKYDEVLMLRRADGRGNSATGATDAYVDWRHVGPGVPWRHNPLPTPPAAEPEPQPAWQTTNTQSRCLVQWPIARSNGLWRINFDSCWHDSGPHGQDLIKPISEAPEPAPVSSARRFVSISRTVNEDGCQTVDAIDDEGIAWWMVPGETGWQQLAALPAREVPAQ